MLESTTNRAFVTRTPSLLKYVCSSKITSRNILALIVAYECHGNWWNFPDAATRLAKACKYHIGVRLRQFLLFSLMLIPVMAYADGYGLFSKHEELKGHVVVAAGDFEKIEIRSSSGYSTLELLKLGSNCFEPLGATGIWGFGKKAGLVLVDRNRSMRVALIESLVGSIKIELLSVTQVSCSAGSSTLDGDPQQTLDQLRRQQQELQRQLERLRQLRQ